MPRSATSLMLSFRAMFYPTKAGGLDARIGCRFGAETFLVRIAHGALSVARGPLDGATLVFVGEPAALAEAVYGQRPLETLEGKGALTIEGTRILAERVATLFSLPSKER